MNEIGDVRAAADEVCRSKAAAEKSSKALITQVNDLNRKCEEAGLNLSDYDNAKHKMTSENADLLRQLQEMENVVFMNVKVRDNLANALDEQKRICEDESKERVSLLSKYRNLEHEFDGLRDQYDEEDMNRDNISNQLSKANMEAEAMRKKYEIDGLQKAEELEMSKLKLQARLAESQGTLDNLNNKQVQLEKAKSKLQAELDEMAIQLDQAHIMHATMEKRAKQFDRIVAEWKSKVDGLSLDLDASQNETRNSSSELFRVKNAYDEAVIQLDEVRRENKNLSNEIKDIMDQITEGGRSIHEIDKIRKRLEAEKNELQAALEEAEATLEQEENKVLRCQLELTQVKTEI